MKYDKFFEIAKNKHIDESELYFHEGYSLSFSLFHGEIDNYSISNAYSISARGLVNGKMGSCSSDMYNSKKAEILANEILENARVIEKNEPQFIFKGSPKYHKVNVYNKELNKIDINKKKQLLFELEKKIKNYDKRISEVASVGYDEVSNKYTLLNSHGLKLSTKNNWYIFYGEAIAKSGDKVKTGSDVFFANNFSKFNVDELAKRVAEKTLSQLDCVPCTTAKYKAVLSHDVIDSLIDVLISHTSAEAVQKNTSLFIDKLDKQVTSKHITISDKPLAKTLFARGFDDEGVATYNKDIIKNGVLKMFLHNLTTASKGNTTTTANGVKVGGKVSVGTTYLYIKPGKKTLDELFKEVYDGIYITEVSGLHAGLNGQSGNFSLKAEGFLIEKGKQGKALELITISGNIIDLFNDVVFVGSDSVEHIDGVNTPSMMIKSLNVSGK